MSSNAAFSCALTGASLGSLSAGFLLTSGFLGDYVSPSLGRVQHLHCTALPDWVEYLDLTMSVILLVPSWGAVFNGFLRLNGAWDKVRTDPAVRSMMVAVLFFGRTTFEGSFRAILPVNMLSHYTDWTVGHVRAGALGWVAFLSLDADGAFVYAFIDVVDAMPPVSWRAPSAGCSVCWGRIWGLNLLKNHCRAAVRTQSSWHSKRGRYEHPTSNA